MHDEERNFEEDLELKVSNKFSDDLKAFFKPGTTVAPEVDRAIMDRAYQKLIGRQKRRRIFRWSVSVAAAAVVIFVCTLSILRNPPSAPRYVMVTAKTDIDQNGSVNVLDAFQLARHIETTSKPDMKWDLNGDGLVNRDDVDLVAFAAVRLNGRVL